MTPARPRIVWLDIARTIALVAMAIFHFCYDLAIFGLIDADTVVRGPLRIFAICIAGSFIALAGVSLQIAHGDGIRWNGFGRRLASRSTSDLMVNSREIKSSTPSWSTRSWPAYTRVSPAKSST